MSRLLVQSHYVSAKPWTNSDECRYKALNVCELKAVAPKCLQADASMQEWITIINDFHHIEKITFTLKLRSAQDMKYILWNQTPCSALMCVPYQASVPYL